MKHSLTMKFDKKISIDEETMNFLKIILPEKDKWNLKKNIYKVHPELKGIVKGTENLTLDNLFMPFRTYIKKYRKDCREEIAYAIDVFRTDWNRISYKYISLLLNIFETEAPRFNKNIYAYVSICPVNAKEIDKLAFSIYYKASPNQGRMFAGREIFQLIYYKKWQEVFGENENFVLEYPSLVWGLGEILATVIMNSDYRIPKIIESYSIGYTTLEEINLRNDNLIRYFEKMYFTWQKSQKPFSDFLKKCWDRALYLRDKIE